MSIETAKKKITGRNVPALRMSGRHDLYNRKSGASHLGVSKAKMQQTAHADTELEQTTETAVQGPIDVAGNSLRIFAESQPLCQAMVQDILAAKSRIWLETYIFVDDEFGRAIRDALIDRAQAGLDVRVIYDAFGSMESSSAFFRQLTAAGVKVHAYHSLAESLRKLSLIWMFNRRTHRKLLVVDESAAYFGGMNIVDQRQLTTVEATKARHLPTSAGWRDVHVRLQGPAYLGIANAFEYVWNKVHDRKKRGLSVWADIDSIGRTKEELHLFASEPGYRRRSPARLFASMLRRAKKQVIISMAYFLPYGSVLRELFRLRRRGVRVIAIVPGKSDVRLVQWATRHFYHKLHKVGIEIYERQHCMLHSKTIVIDDNLCIVGSCNLDARSLRLNLEFMGVMVSRPFAAAVQHICDYERSQSIPVSKEMYARRSFFQWARDAFAWSLRRWL